MDTYSTEDILISFDSCFRHLELVVYLFVLLCAGIAQAGAFGN